MAMRDLKQFGVKKGAKTIIYLIAYKNCPSVTFTTLIFMFTMVTFTVDPLKLKLLFN